MLKPRERDVIDAHDHPSPCKLIVFPLRKRVSRVRRVAEVLLRKNGKAADSYWRQVSVALDAQMMRAGIGLDERRRELAAFHQAVQAELQRTPSNLQPVDPHGGNAA
jgi:hypothetical protein